MRTFTITTRKKDQVVDITGTVENYLQQEKMSKVSARSLLLIRLVLSQPLI